MLLNIVFIDIDKIVLSRNILFDKKVTILSKINNIIRIC